MPSLVNAAKLERVSGGKIAMMAWLGTPLGRKQWAHKSDWDNWQAQRRAAYHRSREKSADDSDTENDGLTAPAAPFGDHEPILVIPAPEK